MLEQVLQTKWESPVARTKGHPKSQAPDWKQFSRTPFPILCPFGPKVFICNVPQLKEDLERNMEEFSKSGSEFTVWFHHHFIAL
jgi:hypothetical protein